MVNIKPLITSVLLPEIIAYWHQVIDAPDVNKITVFSNGTSQGLNTSIPIGGQTDPIWIDGDKLEWKYAQKNDTNIKTSDTINNTKPILTLALIKGNCLYKNVVSRITSRNQENMTNKIKIKPDKTK